MSDAIANQLQQHAASLGVQQQPHLGQPGAMPVSVGGLLPNGDLGAPPVPLESASPGSQVAVFAPGFEHGEVCTVIKMESEWGPTSVPALHLISKATGERKLLPSSIQGARIEILVSAESLGIERAPENAIRARVKPIDVIAMQWKGGAASAAQFIMWSTGALVLQYDGDEGNDGQNEYLLVQKLDQAAGDYMRPGDWLIKAPDGAFRVVTQGDFPIEFEEVAFHG